MLDHWWQLYLYVGFFYAVCLFITLVFVDDELKEQRNQVFSTPGIALFVIFMFAILWPLAVVIGIVGLFARSFKND